MICLSLCCVIFRLLALADCSTPEENNLNIYKDARTKFADLLKEIINVNQKRFDAIKDLTKLQEQNSWGRLLRSKNNALDLEVLTSPMMVVIFIHRPKNNIKFERLKFKMRRRPAIQTTSSFEASSQSNEVYSTNGLFIDSRLKLKSKWSRRRNDFFCVKEATKLCRKSCKRALKDTCLIYRCSSRFKSSTNRNCRTTCKQEFNKGKYDDSDTD